MRILFAQLCKLYTFFLVAIATIVVGAPLENVITTKRATIQTTLPVCPQNYEFNSSFCDHIGRLMVLCKNTNNPADEQIVYQDCEPDETCIEHYHDVEDDLTVPYATCIEDGIRKWDNFDDPTKLACSPEDDYEAGPTDLEIAMTVYANDGKPIQVNYLVAYMNGKELSSVNYMHNYTQVIRNYNHDQIKYCFNSGTDKVTAYAAAWEIQKD